MRAEKKAGAEKAPKPTASCLKERCGEHRVSKDGPARGVVCASWSVPFDKLRAGFRGRFGAPQDEGGWDLQIKTGAARAPACLKGFFPAALDGERIAR